ncbi:MAG: hypothetical protein ABIQ32_03200 [Sphingomicrobium sp.]
MNSAAQQLFDIRDGARRTMFLGALLCRGTEEAPVKIRNMSALGALVDSPIVPAPNSLIQLVRGHYVATGRVVWSGGGRCGIRFCSEISVNDWLAPIEAQRAPPVASEPRATAPLQHVEPAAAPQAEPAPDDLRKAAALVEKVARTLAADAEFLRRHMTEGRSLIAAMNILNRLTERLEPATEQPL